MHVLLTENSSNKFEMYPYFLEECLDLGALHNLCFATFNSFWLQQKHYNKILCNTSLREKILRIFPYSVRMSENTDQKKLRIWTLFMQCHNS